MTNCFQCGTSNVDDSKYCKACGTRLTAPSYIRCHQCQSFNLADSAYCNRCGERLASGTITPPKKITLALSESSSPNLVSPGAEETLDVTRDPEEPTPTLKKSASDLAKLPTELDTSPQELIPTHKLLRMANALNIDVDYNTLRFWQKRGLVPDPKRGPVETGRGTRGYYDASLLDRLAFIREIQKTYALGLDTIGIELEQIDRQIAKTGKPAECYRARLDELRAQHDTETKRTLLVVLGKALGIAPNAIATVIVRKKDGETIRFVADRVPQTDSDYQTETLSKNAKWRIAETIIDPHKSLVLWCVREEFCNRITDFQHHFGSEFPIAKFFDELESSGLCYRSGQIYLLTPLGKVAVDQFDKSELPKTYTVTESVFAAIRRSY
ncbi:MAG: zinc ribbon domain-containing protein [Chloroflexi bacterium]|nr:zinc ribbon domain-containing protein [Chloroflexota bacterium]